MGNIAVVSCADKWHKERFLKDNLCGEDVFFIKVKRKGKRQLKRALERYNIKRAVIDGNIPEFAQNVLAQSGVVICDGTSFIKKLLPTLIARASKYDTASDVCTVYAEKADLQTAEVIKEVSKRYRHVSFCSEAENKEELADYIMDETGLALEFGEYEGGTALVCHGTGGNQNIKIDMVNFTSIALTDKNCRKISVPLAEALCSDGKTYEDLNLKIKLYRSV